MDLRSSYPFDLLRYGLVNSYPSLRRDIHTDVTIVGAGISGALVAWQLFKAGYQVTIVDKRHAATGSTAASTSLLQYEIDLPLHALIEKIGEANAVRSYFLCREAIYKLHDICNEIGQEDLFSFAPSFQFVSTKKDLKNSEVEFRLRKQLGFAVEWFGPAEVKRHYGFNRPGGIFSTDGAIAEAYLLTHHLLAFCAAGGGKVFDHTEVKTINRSGKRIVLKTSAGNKITTRFLVIACGYESKNFIVKKGQRLHSTFAIASEPLMQDTFWYKNSLIWETASPYLYLRTTNDNRIMIGGKDIHSADPRKRDALLPSKARSLALAFKKLFPRIPFRTDFKWAGVFADSEDGLPLIGSIPGEPGIFYTIGLGGNGTTFSVIAGELIRDHLQGKKNPDARIFSFDRL